MKKFIPFFLVILFMFSSCSSFENFVSLEESGLPSWVRNPRVQAGRIAYVTEGSGLSAEEARTDAMANALIEMGDDLGWDVYTEYFRELGSTGTVADLDGSIRETFTREYRGGRFSCYILFDISEDRFLSLRDPELTAVLEREAEIRSLLEDARTSYMENRDIEALSKALNALSLSLDRDLDDPSLDPEKILETVMYYLQPLEIRVSQRGKSMDSSIFVRRNRGLLSPLVYDATLNGYYPIRDNAGVVKEEEIDFNTSEGVYRYTNTNPYALRNGEMRLSFALDSELLSAIESKAPDGFMNEFLETLSSKTVSYEYDERTADNTLPFDVLIAEYDIHGALLDDTVALSSFNASLSDSDRVLEADRGYGDDDGEILSSYVSEGGDKRYLVIMRLGVSDSVTVSADRYMVNVRTSVDVYDLEEDMLLTSDDSVSSIGYGSSYQEAQQNALKNAGKMLADVFLIEM